MCRASFLSFFQVFSGLFFVGMIPLKEALEIMHSGEIFSCEVVQYDRRRKNNRGNVLHIEAGKLIWADPKKDADKKELQGERPMTQLERSLVFARYDIDKRRPNHSHWYTRNVRVYIDGNPSEIIRKIHPALIIKFNNQITTV